MQCDGCPARSRFTGCPSALAGGALLVCADVAVRLLPTDAELKLGVAAALLGGPIFALIAARLVARGGER